MAKSQKYRNLAHHDKVAFVVDDIASRNPWRVRCLEIRGTAEQAVTASGQVAPAGDVLDSAIIRITPRRIISFGIDDTDTEPHRLEPDSRDAAPALYAPTRFAGARLRVLRSHAWSGPVPTAGR